jgi:hypothetical protein
MSKKHILLWGFGVGSRLFALCLIVLVAFFVDLFMPKKHALPW